MAPALLYFILNILLIRDPLYSLVAFHSLFNIIGISIFMPFIDRFIHFLQTLLPTRHDKAELGIHIEQVPPSISDAAITAVKKELYNLIVHSIRLNIRCFKLKSEKVFPTDLTDMISGHYRYEDDYAQIKRSSGEFLGYTYSVQSLTSDETDIRELTQINHAIRNVGYATKFIKDVRHNLADFRHSESDYIQDQHLAFASWFEFLNRQLLNLLANRNPGLFVEKRDDLVPVLRGQYEKNLQNIYHDSGKNLMDDEQTSNLIYVNRAIYLSTQAILNALSVLNATGSELETEIITPANP
ncbi:MAG: hypothetical protein HKN08_06900 [Gammaproteobacteria bacterium]|nr:hypothetical protein [Gammaproteobacteria bacterium]